MNPHYFRTKTLHPETPFLKNRPLEDKLIECMQAKIFISFHSYHPKLESRRLSRMDIWIV